MHILIHSICTKITKAAHTISLLLFPPLCIGCRQYSEKRNQLCNTCKKSLEPVVSHDIPITNTHIATIYAYTRYSGIIQKLIRLKNYKQPQGSYVLGALLAEQYNDRMHDVSYIIPVPLHWTRQLWRGFNQAENMAHICAKKWNVPLAPILIRSKKTPQLAKLSKIEREATLASCFALSYKAIQNKKLYKDTVVAIIDDLCTSGSTIREMSKILYTLGVKEVRVIVAARTC